VLSALQVLLGGLTTRWASLPISLLAYRVTYPVVSQEPNEFSRGYTLFFRTVLPAHTLVRRVNENAFASIVQARPCPVFGRPVHPGSRLRLRPGASPHALRISPHGEHPALQWFVTTGQRDITPAFGYGAPHLSTRGTSTLLINALPGAHYKSRPTFSDALALVREEVWQHRSFQLSQIQYDKRKVSPKLMDYLQNAAFYTP